MATRGNAPRTNDAPSKRRSLQHPPCDLYVPGHLVHFIQAKRAWASGDPVRWGRFGGIEDGRLVVRFLDGAARYRIHRPDEVAKVAEVGDKVRVVESLRFANISRRFRGVLSVCIALPDDPWRPCSVASNADASLEDLADRLNDRGGFVVPGHLLAGLTGSQSDDEDGEPPPAPA